MAVQSDHGPSDWASPVCVTNEAGRSPVVIVCEHASNVIPQSLNNLGVGADVLQSHVAWDPGALPVAAIMSKILGAPLVAAGISRLVYDCNRPPSAESAMPPVSEIFEIPGNASLTESERQERVERIYRPFHVTLGDVIETRSAISVPPAVVTVHSFTPTYKGAARPVEIGILHDTDSRLADAMLDQGSAFNGFDVRRNEPYGPEDGVTHTLREHALPRGLLNVMIEVRNDIITDSVQQTRMADLLSGIVIRALAQFGLAAGPGAGNARQQG